MVRKTYKSYRCRHDFILDVLKAARKPRTMTELVAAVHSNHPNTAAALTALEKERMVGPGPQEGTYSITLLGDAYIAWWEEGEERFGLD